MLRTAFTYLYFLNRCMVRGKDKQQLHWQGADSWNYPEYMERKTCSLLPSQFSSMFFLSLPRHSEMKCKIRARLENFSPRTKKKSPNFAWKSWQGNIPEVHPSGLADPGVEGKLLEQDYRLSLKQKTNTLKAKEESVFKVLAHPGIQHIPFCQIIPKGKWAVTVLQSREGRRTPCNLFWLQPILSGWETVKPVEGTHKPQCCLLGTPANMSIPDLIAWGVFPHFCTCLFYTQL